MSIQTPITAHEARDQIYRHHFVRPFGSSPIYSGR